MSYKLPHKLTLLIGTVLIADVVVVLLHLAFGQDNHFFNLDWEQNLPTVYQTFKLFLTAGLTLTHIIAITYLYKHVSRLELVIWAMFMGLFFMLAIDEVGQIHESLGGTLAQFFPQQVENYTELSHDAGFRSSDWLLFYWPIFLVGATFLLGVAAYFWKRYRLLTLLVPLGTLLFLMAPVLEFVNTNDTYLASINIPYQAAMVIEESAEMLGATVFMYFAAQVLRRNLQQARQAV